jgi:hypothetical protein
MGRASTTNSERTSNGTNAPLNLFHMPQVVNSLAEQQPNSTNKTNEYNNLTFNANRDAPKVAPSSMSCPHYPRLGSTPHENKFGWLASGLRQRRQRHLHAIPPEHIGDLLKNVRGINALRLRFRFSELTDDVSLPIRSNRP